jgi:hypothetical protein
MATERLAVLAQTRPVKVAAVAAVPAEAQPVRFSAVQRAALVATISAASVAVQPRQAWAIPALMAAADQVPVAQVHPAAMAVPAGLVRIFFHP